MEHSAQNTRFQEQNDEGEIAASVYYSNHDLREMFSRENAERRRTGGKMLRKLLTAAQDKKCMAQMVKIRAAYDVANNDDVILVWVKQQIDAGNVDELHAELVKAALQTKIPERTTPWDDEKGH